MRVRVPRRRAPELRSLRLPRVTGLVSRLPRFLLTSWRRLRETGLLPMLSWLAIVGLAFADAAYVRDHSRVPYASVLIGAITMAPIALLLLRAAPLLAWAASMVSAVGYPLLSEQSSSELPWTPLQLLVAGVVLVAVGWRYRPWVLALAWIGTVGAISVTTTRDLGVPVSGFAFAAAVALAGGWLAGARRRADRTASEQEQQLAQESSRRVVLEERARIARELHDVVAHRMSVIAVQAETAPFRVAPLSVDARHAFDQIASDARTGLSEMRRLLGLLRNETQPAQVLTEPQPTLSDLDMLVDSARRAGLDAELITTGDLGHPSAALGLTIYRLVQESLSNVVRHAPGARVLVSVSRTDGTVQVVVRNSSPTQPPQLDGWPPTDRGHGLAGMRERVALLDGQITTHGEPGGGFVVQATMPYESVSPPAAAETT